jgi:hypothetical protein
MNNMKNQKSKASKQKQITLQSESQIKRRIKKMDDSIMESCQLPITDEAISQIPAIAQLCQLFQRIIDSNDLDISHYSKMSVASKMNLGREEFSSLLKFMRAECLDEEAHLFFDYLLH